MEVTVDFYDSETLVCTGVSEINDDNHFIELLDDNGDVIEYFLKEHVSSVESEAE